MRHKHFYVIAYDIGDDRRRSRVVKILESLGTRMNYSVFECMLTERQYGQMMQRLEKIVLDGKDWINIYPVCRDCFAHIRYLPDRPRTPKDRVAVVE